MSTTPRRVIIMGAAGRDFHDFNTVFRTDPTIEVICFTATQIPNIEGRRYPAALASLFAGSFALIPGLAYEDWARLRGGQERAGEIKAP